MQDGQPVTHSNDTSLMGGGQPAPVSEVQGNQQPQAQPTQGGQQEPQLSPQEEVAYWKQVAEQNREKAQAFSEYEVLIEHMNNNPEHVAQFQAIATGQAQAIAVAEGMAQDAGNRSQQMTEEELLAEEIGLPTSAPAPNAYPQVPQQPQRPQMTIQEAERAGAMKERMRLELEQFKTSMMTEGGLGEHMIDQFLQWLKEPNGMTYHDLFAAWRTNQTRANGRDPLDPAPQQQQPVPQAGGRNGVMPQTVGSLPGGESNRPGNVIQDGDPGGRVHKHVVDPANI